MSRRLVAYVQRVQPPTPLAQKQQRRFWSLVSQKEAHLYLVVESESKP
jgi:hypothetical protein